MNELTMKNTAFATDETMLNQSYNNLTTINKLVLTETTIKPGTVLLNKYIIEEKLNVTSGEALLYVCRYNDSRYNDSRYIAKIYNRNGAIKAEIIDKLKTINSEYIAQICDAGEYNGLTVTVLPYYELGSLKGKKFTLSELKEYIIPCINKALKLLHDVGVLHKDLKPENIMLLPNRKGVALIDFGISSVIDSDVSMLVTQSGWTLNYAAPEALRGVYLEESDYYSFGITIYELYNGRNPYQGLSTDEIARYLSIQKLPYPKEMPLELQELITGLTYNDLIHRNELKNPNRRWTYEEVNNWLNGKRQAVPGEGIDNSLDIYMGYRFNGVLYNNMEELALALINNPLEGKKHLERKLLSEYFKKNNQEVASYCIDAEEELKKGEDINLIFWKLVYKMAPAIGVFFWKDKSYTNLSELGEEIQKSVKNNDYDMKGFWNEILENRLISQYLTYCNVQNEIIKSIVSIEDTSKDRGYDDSKYYLLSYLLTGKTEFNIDDKTFYTIEELAAYINELLATSLERFEEFCFKLISIDNKLIPEFESWLIALGKWEELERWKNKLRVE